MQFLGELFVDKDLDPKIAVIGQAILIPPLQIALGIQLHHKSAIDTVTVEMRREETHLRYGLKNIIYNTLMKSSEMDGKALKLKGKRREKERLTQVEFQR